MPGPLSWMQDLAEHGQLEIIDRYRMDLREIYEWWASIRNKTGFDYKDISEKIKTDYVIFQKVNG
jgi:phage terminase large subunit-like protein